MAKFAFLLCVVCIWLCGCDEAALIRRTLPLRNDPDAQRYLDLLMHGKVDEIQKDLDPAITEPDMREKLLQVADWLPAEEPRSIKVVDSRTIRNPQFNRTDIGYECEFQGSWYLVTMSIARRPSAVSILALHVNRLPDSLENMHRFTLAGKGFNQYFILLLTLGSLALSFYAARECIRTRVGPSKWLWLSAILTGVGGLFVDWTTGQIALQIWSIHVPPAVAGAAPFGPWMIGASFPLGALIFLNERWREKVFAEPLSESDLKVKAAMDELRRKWTTEEAQRF
jgi:hypothetical protein